MRLFDDKGRAIALGKRIAAGGEGEVFEVAGDTTLVAKIYHKPPSQLKARKLEAMVGLATPAILKFAAWPTSLLRKVGSRSASPDGLLMRRIQEGRPIHELDSPSHRRAFFPHADWRFLVRTARNCAASVCVIHDAGFVVGDVNYGGFLVASNALVNVIDCDSFQIRTPRGETYLCEVAMPEFLPPELFGHSLASVLRTPNHDSFGLGIILFRLLMMGRHPFAGYRGAGDKPIPDCIKEYRFAFASDAAQNQMAPPPHSLLLDDLPKSISELFLRTFSRGSERPGARPSAQQWVRELEELEHSLEPCSNDPGHYYFCGCRECPWCRIEREKGPTYFISVTIQALGTSSGAIDVDRIWMEINSVPPPRHWAQIAPSSPPSSITPMPVPATAHERQHTIGVLGMLTLASSALSVLAIISINFLYISLTISFVMAALVIMLYFTSPMFRIRKERWSIYWENSRELKRLERDADGEVQRRQDAFDKQLADLAWCKQRLAKLQSEEHFELQDLELHARERQLEEYLEGLFIRDAKIDGIGRSRVAILESYGIETAHDVDADIISLIPGFGPMLTGNLLAWRALHESRFQFNPAKGVPPADVVRIRSRYRQMRFSLEQRLAAGRKELTEISDATRNHLRATVGPIQAQRQRSLQAKADFDACWK
jgi:DNA-binding helix-hairpin-helix protein with protein kinase domain